MKNSMDNLQLKEAIVYRESHSLSYLKGIMDKDAEVRRLLTTPIGLLEGNELDLNYNFLVGRELFII